VKWLNDKPDGKRANLRGANLRGADLRGADLYDADLRDADLYDAYLCDADLRGADLRGANLRGADLRDAKNVPFIPMTCPESGSYIAYKKASGVIVVLRILEDALRSSATGRKCRASKAEVLRIEDLDGSCLTVDSVNSSYDPNFIYRPGEIVSVDNFDTNRWNECAPGIHHFINRQEAVDY
jgi:uncharacterized protein YjbI with pentapeptide repeats